LGEGVDLGNLGATYHQLGKLGKAIGFFEQQLVIAREIGDRRGEGSDLANLGVAYADLGESGKAVVLLEQALEIGRAIKDPEIIRVTTAELARLRGGGRGQGE
jgi:tetratricopeptide (TPR) repeat protein